MPTYSVFATEGRLSAHQKSRIADVITRAHAGATGAPSYFAEVIFSSVRAGDWFIGGALLDADQIFVQGQIRAGRTAEVKATLIEDLTQGVADAADAQRESVWCYLVEIPPEQMVEFGRVLPKSGEEEAWAAEMPTHERIRLESIGKSQIDQI